MNPQIKGYSSRIIKALEREIAERKKKRGELVYSLLPDYLSKEQGKTRRQLVTELALDSPMSAKEVGKHLQALKQKQRARCYKGSKWRKTKSRFSLLSKS
ncbi:MAG: hypothetical protein HY673_06625 [Chloroflexi bacterium]|nr:hypothetical protein [Chloroflexota bacterium]